MTAHFRAIVFCAGGILVFTTLGVAAHSGRRSRPFELGMGLLGTGVIMLKYMWYWGHGRSGELFVPLHLCNLAELLACAALLTRWYWFRSLLYFWSLGAVMVFVTPEPPDAPGTFVYALFWASHAFILAVTTYELVVARLRPRLRDLGVAVGVTLCYVGVVLPVDIIFGKNYGYVGPTQPSVKTLIDVLGPWPLRVIWVVLIGASVFVLAWLPWAVLPCRGERSDGAGREDC